MVRGPEKTLSALDVVTGYGKKQVLNGVSIETACGEVVAVFGHNGSGKSTLLKAMFGMLPLRSGEISLENSPLRGATPRDLLRAGLAFVPQGNRVFANLSVLENLKLGNLMLGRREELDENVESALEIFPLLKRRVRQLAGTLSGGEKQMLAMANALAMRPRYLLLDEPCLGLAAPLAERALSCIRNIADQHNAGIVIVEQRIREALRIADRVYVIRRGEVSYSGHAESLANVDLLREVYL